jgi:dTDP-4-amino-4,6-dideoxygalactose transaminase
MTGEFPPRKAFGEDEQDAIDDVVSYYRRSDEDPGYNGFFQKQFEKDLAAFYGKGEAAAVNSGTNALYIALCALNLKQGREVIVSPVTDSGTVHAILAAGLVPVVADAAPGGYNTGLNQVTDCVTDLTAAVMLVHTAGEPVADTEAIAKLCENGAIPLIEDVSQAMGANIDGRLVGSFGTLAAGSMMYRKNLQCGGSGGFVYGVNPDLIKHVMAHRDRGKQPWRDDINQNDPGTALFPALNHNFNEWGSAIASASLKRLKRTNLDRLMFLYSLREKMQMAGCLSELQEFHSGYAPFYIPVWVPVKDKLGFAMRLKTKGIPLLEHYGCLVADWLHIEKQVNWQPNHAYSEGHVPWAARSPNARHTRDSTFNLFLNENYDIWHVRRIVNAIKETETEMREDLRATPRK